jgi:hypothetical protein
MKDVFSRCLKKTAVQVFTETICNYMCSCRLASHAFTYYAIVATSGKLVHTARDYPIVKRVFNKIKKSKPGQN